MALWVFRAFAAPDANPEPPCQTLVPVEVVATLGAGAGVGLAMELPTPPRTSPTTSAAAIPAMNFDLFMFFTSLSRVRMGYAVLFSVSRSHQETNVTTLPYTFFLFHQLPLDIELDDPEPDLLQEPPLLLLGLHDDPLEFGRRLVMLPLLLPPELLLHDEDNLVVRSSEVIPELEPLQLPRVGPLDPHALQLPSFIPYQDPECCQGPYCSQPLRIRCPSHTDELRIPYEFAPATTPVDPPADVATEGWLGPPVPRRITTVPTTGAAMRLMTSRPAAILAAGVNRSGGSAYPSLAARSG